MFVLQFIVNGTIESVDAGSDNVDALKQFAVTLNANEPLEWINYAGSNYSAAVEGGADDTELMGYRIVEIQKV